MAVIDTGVNPAHPHVQRVVGGFGVTCDPRGHCLRTDDCRDEVGHGTAVCGLIAWKAPACRLLVVKVAGRGMRCPSEAVLFAMEESLRQGAQVVNVSLATDHQGLAAWWAATCQKAAALGAVVVAAAMEGVSRPIPASLPGVLGVRGDPGLGEDEIAWEEDDPCPWRALPLPRPLPGLPPHVNFAGSSFAAARIAAAAASEMAREPGLDPAEVTRRMKGSRCMRGSRRIRKVGR